MRRHRVDRDPGLDTAPGRVLGQQLGLLQHGVAGGGVDEQRREPGQGGVQRVEQRVVGRLAGHPVDDPLLSPLQTSLAGLPPLLIQAASGDAVLQEAQLLARHATQCGVDASITVYPVPTHDFHVFWSFLPEARDAIDQIGRFVRTVARPPGESAADQSG